MALRLGELSAIISVDDSDFDRKLSRAERRFDRFADHLAGRGNAGEAAESGAQVGESFAEGAAKRVRDSRGRFMSAAAAALVGAAPAAGAGGARVGEEIVGGAARRLRDSRGRFVSAAADVGQRSAVGFGSGFLSALGSVLGPTVGQVSQLWGTLGSVGGAVGSILQVVAAIVALGAALAAAVPAGFVLAGALGAIPAVSAGAAAGIGALVIGFLGISDAFEKTKSSGGGAANTADRVASAERGLARAQREVVKAQQALNEAREQAVEDLSDLNRQLRRSQIDERKAAEALAEAERDLQRARRGGNAQKIRDAQLAYEDAQLTVEETQDRTQDLTREQERSAQAGVEGSQKVRDALDRQQQAVDSLADAESSLRQARTGGGGGVADEVTKLAPAAQEAVNVIKSLKSSFESLRLDVQQHLFAGVGEQIQALSGAWLQGLQQELTRYADTFNGIFQTLSSTLQDPAVIEGFSAGMESVRGLLDKVGQAASGPFVRALSQLAKAAKPFIDALGGVGAGAIQSFADWIGRLSQAGEGGGPSKLEQFFSKAGDFLRDVAGVGKDVGKIIGEIFSALTGATTNDVGESPWEKIKTTIHDLADWFADPKNKAFVVAFFETIFFLFNLLITVAGWLIGTYVSVQNAIVDAGLKVKKAVGEFFDWIGKKWNETIDWLRSLGPRIGRATAGMWDGIKDAFKSAINAVIRWWNNLSFAAPSIGPFAGFRVDTPNIPMLANGGTIMSAGMAVVGERGPERVFLPGGATVQPLPRSGGGGGFAGGVIRVIVEGTGVVRGLRSEIAYQGGDVQTVLGAA